MFLFLFLIRCFVALFYKSVQTSAHSEQSLKGHDGEIEDRVRQTRVIGIILIQQEQKRLASNGQSV